MWGEANTRPSAPPAMYPAVGGATSEGVDVGVDAQLHERVRQLQVSGTHWFAELQSGGRVVGGVPTPPPWRQTIVT